MAQGLEFNKIMVGNVTYLVEDETARAGLQNKLDKAGGQVTGHITTTQTEFTQDQQLVTKKYVDDNAGGGGGVYTETVLYTASDTSSVANTITLSHPYTDFDELVIINGDMPNSRLLTSDINLGIVNPMTNAISFSWLLGDVCASTRYVFTSTTTMQFAQEVRTGSASGNNIHYVIGKIIGIKYGA